VLHSVAIETRHHDVEEEDVGQAALLDDREGIETTRRELDLVAHPQRLFGQQRRVPRAVDHRHGRPPGNPRAGSRGLDTLPCFHRRPLGTRQLLKVTPHHLGRFSQK
jgi:hypothetical protein